MKTRHLLSSLFVSTGIGVVAVFRARRNNKLKYNWPCALAPCLRTTEVGGGADCKKLDSSISFCFLFLQIRG